MANRVLVSFRNPAKAEPYLAALRTCGVEPIGCTPGAHASLGDIHALVLTGGGDILPSYYGQEPTPELGEVDAERDAFELGLLTLADAANLPTLAICRGMQLLNVHRGGTLIQHLAQSDRHRRNDTPKPQPVHNVRIEASSMLGEIMREPSARVNSRHHQAIDRLASGLTVTARATGDDVIEAVEDRSRRFLIGVQWHPEDQAPRDEAHRRIFAALCGCL